VTDIDQRQWARSQAVLEYCEREPTGALANTEPGAGAWKRFGDGKEHRMRYQIILAALLMVVPAVAQSETPATPAAKPLLLQNWAIGAYSGLWRFNTVVDGNATYGVLRLSPDGTTSEQTGGKTADGVMFDGIPQTGRWSASIDTFGDGGFLITVTQDGEDGGNDIYQIYEDDTLRRGENVWKRLRP
jgi:hypothetical protein